MESSGGGEKLEIFECLLSAAFEGEVCFRMESLDDGLAPGLESELAPFLPSLFLIT